MAAGRYSSRVFEAGTALYNRLQQSQWPIHPVTGKPPSVEFSDERPGEVSEAIVLGLNVDESTINWARQSPAGRNEVITFNVTIHAETPNVKTSAAVWERLGELATVVQSVVFDPTRERVNVVGFSGELEAGQVTGVRPQVTPTKEGWIGRCVVTIQLLASI